MQRHATPRHCVNFWWADEPRLLLITSPAAVVAKYCNEHVCVCLCVCLLVYLSASISPEPHERPLPIFVHVAYRRGLVLLWRDDAVLRRKGILGVFFSIKNTLYGPYSGMNFTMKDRFGLNLLYPKVGQNSISLWKGIIVTNYFDITCKVNYKKNGEIWQLMGRITETHDKVFNVTMVTVYVADKINIYWWSRIAKLI